LGFFVVSKIFMVNKSRPQKGKETAAWRVYFRIRKKERKESQYFVCCCAIIKHEISGFLQEFRLVNLKVMPTFNATVIIVVRSSHFYMYMYIIRP
jgi:hypothetical protein